MILILPGILLLLIGIGILFGSGWIIAFIFNLMSASGGPTTSPDVPDAYMKKKRKISTGKRSLAIIFIVVGLILILAGIVSP